MSAREDAVMVAGSIALAAAAVAAWDLPDGRRYIGIAAVVMQLLLALTLAARVASAKTPSLTVVVRDWMTRQVHADGPMPWRRFWNWALGTRRIPRWL